MANNGHKKYSAMSGMQYVALRQFSNQARQGKRFLTAKEIGAFKQTTMGSFAVRKYLQKVGPEEYYITDELLQARTDFEAADIYRQTISEELSIRFQNQRIQKIKNIQKS